MIDEILDIPGNRFAYDQLFRLLRSGEAVAFIGAGASAGLYPLWEGLLGELIDAVRVRGSIGEDRLQQWLRDGGKDPLGVARRVRKELGDSEYFGFLERRFALPLSGPTFTPTHAALAALPFDRFVTTNFDSSLTQALAAAGEPLSLPVTWKDLAVSRWLRDESVGSGRPVLHAHGSYSRTDTLVLDRDRYREAYDSDAYRRLFEMLWIRGKLVTIGFSFTDPWLGLLTDSALRSSGQPGNLELRHVAILGLDDMRQLDDLRGDIEDVYHGRVLVYRIEDGKHDALGHLLEGLGHLLRTPSQNLDTALETFSTVTDETATSAPLVEPTVVDRWLDVVVEEHRRLTDHFDRPAELSLLETAWVRLELSRSTEGRTDRDGITEERLHERSAPGRSTLDTYLDLDRTDPANRWVTGRWLVEGDPGSGKTTLLRYLAARRAKASRAGASDAVPLFLSLPKLTGPKKLLMPLEFVRDEVANRCGEGLAELLDIAGREGRLLVLLDALDEVPPERRDRVGTVLSWVAAEWPGATVVMSSRPIGQGDVSDDFVKLDLQPLDPAQRLEFLSKWFVSETTAEIAAKHFDREESLRALSLNPLHLTLLAVLWERGIEAPRRRSELYDEILAMLLGGKHRERGKAMEPQKATREILRGLAWAHTVDDVPAELPEQLADRLLTDDFDEQRGKIEKLWPSHRDFLDAVAERTYILGPHDGAQNPWRFWHRTLREALAAERLDQIRETDGEDTILERVEALEDDDEGRWAEPFALLAGKDGSDRLIVELTRRRPSLGVRALETAQGLSADTLVEILGALEHPSQRGAVYEAIPSQLDDADTALDLVNHLRQQTRNGSDLFFLDLACRVTGDRWPAASDAAAERRGRLYDHIPAPPGDLFRRFTTPQGETKNLWCTIPAGVYSIGSDDHDDAEKPCHPVEVVKPYSMAAVTVTNAQYAAFDPGKAPHRWVGMPDDQLPDHPRVDVTWWEVVSFCRWLATLPGFECARLPSEEEWEVACRAGSTTEYWNGAGKVALDPIGWYGQGYGVRAHRVAEKLPNPWGLYDVHGNVLEWASTVWDEERYRDRSTEPFAVDPTAPPADLTEPRAFRAVRGGSCWNSADYARSAFRLWWHPEAEIWYVGFRVLLPSPERI